ncbi:SMI1/KNR4 family protein [Kitasatospora sp. NPDC057015]|uniref:SMI1/KNR4 family protein n=1 Tax=Kitasatospora sp. NPDC057015 TaxID=3346001 RepID=UPI0036266D0D
MTDHGGLVRRVAERARSREQALPAPVSARELADAEDELGVALPPLLARLYREVANGGFGPGYQLLPLVGPGRTVLAVHRAEQERVRGGESPRWPAGVVPVMDWGCGMFAAVDCLGGAGTVLLFEPNGVVDRWEDAWYVDADCLAGWLETWFAGMAWYEEISGAGMRATEPRPWEEVEARLSAPDPDRAP